MARLTKGWPVFKLLLCVLTLSTLGTAKLPRDFKCPTSIDTTIPNHRHTQHGQEHLEPYSSMHNLHAVMSRCSDISDLKLRVTLLGCSEWPDRWNFPFDQAGTDSFPSRPERLSLEGYHFGEKEWESNRPPTGWRDLLPASGALWNWERAMTWAFGEQGAAWYRMRQLPVQQREKNNLELWIDAMDFSAVNNLTLRDIRRGSDADALVQSLPSQLPSLKVFELTGSWSLDFLRALPEQSLNHLVWRSSRLLRRGGGSLHKGVGGSDAEESLNDIWEHIGGPQLQSFEFRDDSCVENGAREMLSADQLQALTVAAPNLRHLTLEFERRNNSWPETEIALIAREFPALESLTLYLELASECRQQNMDDDFGYAEHMARRNGSLGDGCFGEEQFMKPLVNESNASQLFAFVRQENTNAGGGHFKELNLFAGDWERPWDGPLYVPGWLEGRQAWASCSISGSVQDAERKSGGEFPICKAEDRRHGYYDD